jgi:hypothetical protein
MKSTRSTCTTGDASTILTRERALGAHTFFVPVEHTRRAREILGRRRSVVAQKVVLANVPADARRRARGAILLARSPSRPAAVSSTPAT